MLGPLTPMKGKFMSLVSVRYKCSGLDEEHLRGNAEREAMGMEMTVPVAYFAVAIDPLPPSHAVVPSLG